MDNIKNGKLITTGTMEEVVKHESLEDVFMEIHSNE